MEANQSKTNKFFESKFMKSLERFGQKLAANKGFSSISKSMMATLALILVGAVFQIVATIPTLFGWFTTSDQIYNILYTPYNLTMGMISVYLVFMIAYNYSKALGLRPMQNGIVALVCFFAVCAPVQTVTLADGSTTMSVLDFSYLGSQGMFVAILIAILSVKLTKFCLKHNITIKLPDVVPSFLADAFSAMLPLLFNLIIWYGIGTALSLATGGVMTLPLLINYILSIPINALNSVPGMLVVTLIVCLLWSFGIHGTMVAFIALMAILMQSVTANAELVAAGKEPVFYPVLLIYALMTAGGTGNTLGLVLHGLKCKSQQLRSISKMSVVPGLFGINEPITFGFPVMYNPVMVIPFILTPMITVAIVWIGYAIGFFKPAYILLLTLMPIGVGEFLTSMAWQNLFIPVVGIIVGLLVYYPFIKVYDKQLYSNEQAVAMEGESTEN